MKRTVQITLTLLLTLAITPSCDTLEEVDLSDDPTPVFVEPVYIDNSDGMITDTTSNGIMWAKCSNGESDADCSGGLTTAINYTAADNYCRGLTAGGFNDWRIPMKYELGTFSTSYPDYITYFPNYANDKTKYWWSSTPETTSICYAVRFYSYDERYRSLSDSWFIRCARSIQP